jgi:mevalonate kinase
VSTADIPASGLPVAARAPGKCILFGEHAVVFGEPEVVLAIDLYTQVALSRGPEPRINGSSATAAANPYLQEALRVHPSQATQLDVRVVSRLPKAAGLGSSAAFCAALSAALGAVRGGVTREELARSSFELERGAQGVGSPGDTTASVGGGLLSINASGGPIAWEITESDRRWQVRRLQDPHWIWVVAYSGIPRNTGETVRAVGRRLAEPDGPAILERFGGVASEGVDAIRAEDRHRVGQLLDRNHALLRELGVSHPRLEALLEAARPVAQGAKLTGAGAGGSVVILPNPGSELEVSRRVARAGGVPFVVQAAADGTHLVEHLGER